MVTQIVPLDWDGDLLAFLISSQRMGNIMYDLSTLSKSYGSAAALRLVWSLMQSYKGERLIPVSACPIS